MAESRFPMEFPTCRICGCEETVAKIAREVLREQGRLPVDAKYPNLRRVPAPLIPIKSATLTQPHCIQYFDVCAKCGFERCTRVEWQDAPIKMMKVNPDGSTTEVR